MTNEWLASIIAFGRRFLSNFQDKSETLPSDGVFFYTDGLLCEDRKGAGVFSDILEIRESHALGSLVTVFQTELYAILACFGYCRSTNRRIMMICLRSDSKAALLVLSTCIQFRLNFYTNADYQCKISLITTG
jgi:hypothetical protein